MLERYDRTIRDPFKKDVVVIDHISYCMDNQKEQEWYDTIYRLIPSTSNQFRKPHLTVAYSPTPIDDFPKIDYEGEIYYNLSPVNSVTLVSQNTKYGIYTDPFLNNHLVLYTPIDRLVQRFNYYLSRGATWLHGIYDPFIIIETNTLHTDTSISGLPLPDRDFVFNVIRYCRFGETIRE